MKSKKVFYQTIIGFTILSASGYSQNCHECEYDFQENCCNTCTLEDCPIMEPPRTCSGLFAFGEYLYWKPAVTNFYFAVTTTAEQVNFFTFANDENLREVNFKYDSGFRVGIGYQYDCGWNFLVKWARFHTKGKQKLSVPADLDDLNFIEPIWVFLPGKVTNITAKQSLKYDELDFDFVKTLSLGSYFIFKPYFGAVYTKLDQKLSLDSLLLFEGSDGSQETRLFNDFNGAGLQIGIQAEYNPFCWFSIYGNGSTSLLWGKFRLKRNDFFSGNPPLDLEFSRSSPSTTRAVVQALDVNAGIKFGSSFCKETFRFYGYVGYEFVYYPDQVRIPKILSQLFEAFILQGSGNVGFQGITAGAQLEF